MTVSDNIGRAVRHLRHFHRDWTQADLAAQCAALGAPQLSRMVIHDIETGGRGGGRDRARRREVSADELFTLALALHVAPVHLMVPLEDDDECQITPLVTERAELTRQWVSGLHAWPGTDKRIYFAWVPKAQAERFEQAAKLMQIRPEMFQVIEEEGS
jgi:hypothetical protein